jgi:tetratricopeptide (TPR) repeat protein
MATESISDTPENVEITLGDAIKKRTEAVKYFSGMGPPDLCYLIKESTTTSPVFHFFMNPKSTNGFFHWVLGQRIAQLTDITAYLQELLQLQEKAFILATSHCRVVYFHYCTYNAFKKLDFHVLIDHINSESQNFTQKAQFYVVEKDGKKTTIELNDEFWWEIYLSNVFRAIQRPLPHIKPLKLKGCLDSITEEHFFLKIVEKLFWQGPLLGVDPLSGWNLLTASIVRYFMEQRRYESLYGFIQKFVAEDPSLNAILAMIKRKIGAPKEALKLLQYDDDNDTKRSVHVLTEIVKSLLAEGTKEKAIEVAKNALIQFPQQFQAHICLARAYIATNEFAKALETLNSIPIPDTSDVAPKDTIGKVTYARQTEPKNVTPHPDLLIQEEQDLFDLEEAEVDPLLQRLSLTEQENVIYKCLLQIYKTIGYRQLLLLISRLFVKKPTVYSYKGENTSKGKYVPPVFSQEKLIDELPSSSSNTNAEQLQEISLTIEGNDDDEDEFRRVEIDFDKVYVVERKVMKNFFEHALRSLLLDHRAYYSWKRMEKTDDGTLKKKLYPTEWLRLGLVLKRFGNIAESERILTQNVVSKGWYTKAWLELQQIYVKKKDIRNTLLSIHRVLNHWTQSFQTKTAPTETKKVLFMLISFVGLRQVRDVARHLIEIEKVALHPEIHRLILEANLLKIFGADR